VRGAGRGLSTRRTGPLQRNCRQSGSWPRVWWSVIHGRMLVRRYEGAGATALLCRTHLMGPGERRFLAREHLAPRPASKRDSSSTPEARAAARACLTQAVAAVVHVHAPSGGRGLRCSKCVVAALCAIGSHAIQHVVMCDVCGLSRVAGDPPRVVSFHRTGDRLRRWQVCMRRCQHC